MPDYDPKLDFDRVKVFSTCLTALGGGSEDLVAEAQDSRRNTAAATWGSALQMLPVLSQVADRRSQLRAAHEQQGLFRAIQLNDEAAFYVRQGDTITAKKRIDEMRHLPGKLAQTLKKHHLA